MGGPGDPPEIVRVEGIGENTGNLFERLLGGVRQGSKPGRASIDKQRLLELRADRLSQTLRDKEQDLERLRGALNSLEDGALVLDADGGVVFMNGPARDLIGFAEDLYSSEFGMALKGIRARAADTGGVTPSDHPERLDIGGQSLVLRTAAITGDEGVALGTVVFVRDPNSDQVSKQLRNHFLTSISHELRTPMQAVKGAADLLIGKVQDDIRAAQLVETLAHNVDVLDRMVVEMLDLAEMGAGTFQPLVGPVDLPRLMSSILHGMMPDIRQAQLEVRLMVRNAAALEFEADEARLRWAVGHLLRNAIQYTEPDGCIWVAVGLDDLAGESIAVDIVDTGVGISDDDLPRIFDRFYRGTAVTADGSRIEPRGLGQGLFIVREVAAVHGGTVSVESQVGRGSSFTIVLPRHYFN
ncbi:MAG: PAS domain-containing protein [Anaerolineae bacterium]|nr:PAS domain-containing protein [Chloroflexota bacterium]MBV6435582.1 Sensor histidine kinase ResE [Anaerolineae bacterium]MDL1915693.1 PAS domain-containing protein [Anaerolineae bacterium CFX4]OQY86582.1 MAG: hypothetical protein B6D42_00835 [Anaerolineae bacterium UTCFX5]MCO6443490.1 PAS domain-containing protein [Anaerolineae bacterium]